ncbi:VanZ family protein [Microbacterium sp. NPDC016588]
MPIDRDYQGVIARLLAALHRNGVPPWVGYRALESGANALMFVPVGFFAALLLTGRLRWLAVAFVPLLSGAIETWQHFSLPQRVSSVGDVAANSFGGWIGIGLAAGLVGVVHWRDRRLRTRWESVTRRSPVTSRGIEPSSPFVGEETGPVERPEGGGRPCRSCPSGRRIAHTSATVSLRRGSR